MADIKLINISKSFKKEAALKNINFEVKDKEFFILFGPAGAGKTTLLNIIAGIHTPDTGNVYMNRKCIDYIEPEGRNVAMVFEDYALYPHLTVYQNIAFPLKSPRYKLSKDAMDQEVKRVARMLRIDWLLDRNPSELSNGQRQRVGLGRALVRSPEVFLMDEPITHLDAKLRHQMRAELKDMQKNLNTTTIYVTHDYLEALSLGDRIAVINKGQIEQIGTPEEIFYRPANEFVASAFGEPEINIFRAQIVMEKDELKVKFLNRNFAISESIQAIIREMGLKELNIGLRPKYINHSFNKKDDFQIKGKVSSFEPLGAKAILTIEVENIFIRLVVPSENIINRNQEVFVSLEMDNAVFFDGEGNNIFWHRKDSDRRDLVWES